MALRKGWIIAAIVVGVATLLAVYAFLDPSAGGWWPRCFFHELTGWKCPGCGSQRMIHALLNGNIAAAWHHNALLLIIMPLLAAIAIIETGYRRWPQLHRRLSSVGWPIALLVALLAWAVLRNIFGW